MAKETVEMTGACRFCGQQHMIYALEEWTQPQLEEKTKPPNLCRGSSGYAIQHIS